MTNGLPPRPASALATLEAYAGTLLMVGCSTLLGLWIAPRWGTAAVDMIYLPAVLAAAALWGSRGGRHDLSASRARRGCSFGPRRGRERRSRRGRILQCLLHPAGPDLSHRPL